jgi:hypothetical protein
MKVFLAILLYIVCPECRIEDGPVRELSYNVHGDSIPFRVLTGGTTQIKDAPPLLITSDKEYFDYYYSIYGVFPQDFRWDFNKEYILIIYKTLTSGSYGIVVDAVLETPNETIVQYYVSKPEFHTADMSDKFVMLAIKPTDKPIITSQTR